MTVALDQTRDRAGAVVEPGVGAHGALARNGCDVDIVIPVYNEQDGLVDSVGRLYAYLASSFPFSSESLYTTPTFPVAMSMALLNVKTRLMLFDGEPGIATEETVIVLSLNSILLLGFSTRPSIETVVLPAM